MTNLIYGTRLHDMETCYKPITIGSRRLQLECNRFDLEPEITAKVARMGERIAEVPISYKPRVAKAPLARWLAVRALLRYRRWNPAS